MGMRLLALSLILASPLSAQSGWDAFRPGTFAQIIASEKRTLDLAAPSDGRARMNLTGDTRPQRVTVILSGERRPLLDETTRLIDAWGRSIGRDSTWVRRFSNEYRVIENGVDHWVPVQTVLEPSLAQEIPRGGRVTLLTRWLGTVHSTSGPRWIFTANEFEAPGVEAPPSQYALNGFQLGQHVASIDSALGAPWRVIPSRDGGSDRIYVVDRARGSYMAFHFDSAPKGIAVAVQFTGGPGTTMVPFHGIKLGTLREAVISRFGPPTETSHVDDVNVDLLSWVGRNYTIEIDSADRVYSIRISGFDGFRDQPGENEPDRFARLKSAIAGANADSLMAVLAPDIEFYIGERLLSYTKSPRAELGDQNSPVRKELARVAQTLERPADRTPLRINEAREMFLVGQWDRGDVQEMVWRWYPGGYRLWEVKFR
jgi:hypothetical protein